MKLTSAGPIVTVLLVLALPRPIAAQADSFDVPLKKDTVLYELSPYYDPRRNVRIKVSCFSYSTFMVKEYDEGQKGAEWLAIVPSSAPPTPACTRSHAVGERVIEYPEWRGYFKGAKENLVFFYAADGTNGGMPFVVFDSRTGAKIFQDSTFDSKWLHMKVEASPFNEPQFSVSPRGQVFIKYLRVVEASCDLHREKASCWQQVQKRLELKISHIPVCSGYKNIPTRWDSTVAYPVEVSLFPQPATKPIDGPVKCWPVD